MLFSAKKRWVPWWWPRCSPRHQQLRSGREQGHFGFNGATGNEHRFGGML
jgi:hypothetical protein